jgi:tetratricopeptide (TPR) repeat protein
MVRWLVLVVIAVSVAVAAVWWLAMEQGPGLVQPQDAAEEPVARPAYFDIAVQGGDRVVEQLDQAFAAVLRDAENQIELARSAIEILPQQERNTIPAGPDAPVAADFARSYRKFLEQIEIAYRERSADKDNARENAEQFLSDYLDCTAGLQPIPDWEQTRSRGEAALAAGAANPVIRMALAEMWQWLPEKQQAALEALDQTAGELQASEYPPLLAMLARYHAWQTGSRIGAPQRETQAREYLFCDAVIDLLAEEMDNPRGHMVYAALYTPHSRLSDTSRYALVLGALERGARDTFSMHMLAGRIYQNLAWKARGEGFAHEVTEEGWRTFHRLLPQAAGHYMRAWTLDPTSPSPPTAMISVARAGGDDRWSAREWFSVATRTRMDYPVAYNDFRYAITPRWGGSYPQQLAFARSCLDTNRWDTIVPWYAMRVLYEMQKELGVENPVGEVPGVIDVVDRFVSGYQKAKAEGNAESSESSNHWHWAYAASIYAQQGRYEEAHALFESYGEEITQDDCDWAWFKLPYLRGLCAAMTGPANEDLARLRKWIEQPLPADVSAEDLDEPLAEVQRLRTVDDREVVRPYWDDVAAMLKQLQTYHRGEWVEFSLEPSLLGLYLNANVREFSGDGTLMFASAAGSAGCALRPMAWFEPPIIIEGEFAAWTDHEQDTWIGVMNGSPSRAIYGDKNLRGVMLTESRRDSIIHDDQRSGEFGREAWTVIDREFHHLRLRMWPDEVRHECDYAMLKVDDKFQRDASGWVLFGGHRTDLPNSGRMRNLRVRKLDYDPPPETTNLQERAAYWQRLREIHPGDAVVLIQLGVVAYLEGDYEQAEALLREGEMINSELRGTQYYLGATCLQQGRFREAIEYLEGATSNNPESGRSRSVLSWILSSAPDSSVHNPQRALALAEQAYALKSEDYHSLRALAGAHARLGDFEAAADWITQAIDAVTDDEEAQEQLRRYLQMIEAGKPLVFVVKDK